MKLVLIAFGLFCASCNSVPFPDPEEPAFVAPLQTEIMEIETEEAAATSAPEPTPELEGPFVQRTNWLLLGGDYRAHRENTGFGNKTDVIVLISILETDPMQITAVQFPRNLYVPVEGMDDQWLFAVWGNEGWQGLHQYFQRAFGVTLQGIHYVNMDSFVKVVDDLGGLQVQVVQTGFRKMDGDEALAYLRDNENNWELGSYDAGNRVFQVLESLWWRGSTFLLEDPVAAANIVFSQWGDLFETDLSSIKQLYWLFDLGWRVRNNDFDTRMIQLEEPSIVRGDPPIIQNEQPMRGMVADVDLKDWMKCALEIACR